MGDQYGFNQRLVSFKEDRENFFQKLSGGSYTVVDDMQGLRALVSDYLKLRDQYTTITTGTSYMELDDEKHIQYKAKFQPPLQSDSKPMDVAQRAKQLADLCKVLKVKKKDTRRDAQIDTLQKKIFDLYNSSYCDKQALAAAIMKIKLNEDTSGNGQTLKDSSYQTKKLAGLYCDFAVKAKRLECLYAGKDTSEVQLREQVSREEAKEKRSSLTLMQEALCIMPRTQTDRNKLGG